MTVSLKTDDFGSTMLQRINDLEKASNTKLSLSEKIILAEIGTVEQILSILTNCKIRVKITRQRSLKKSIDRQSLIVISDTGEELIYAKSKVFVENLPEQVVEQIKMRQNGIGSIISKFELATFRKIVEIGYKETSDSFFRRYLILYKDKVAFEIEEDLVFRKRLDQSLSLPLSC